jgi:AcrR family transcriptional regulator
MPAKRGRPRRGAGRPPKSEARDTQQAILDAALDVFSAKGFYHASLNDIAAAVGIRDSAIYHYFPSKEALFEAIVTKRAEAPQSDEWRAVLEQPIDDVRSFLEALARASLERFLAPRMQKRIRILMSDGPRLQAEGKLDVLDNVTPLQPVVKIMQRLVKEKRLRSSSSDLLAVEFASPFLTLMMIGIFQPNHSLLNDTASFARDHVDHFLRANART